MHASRIALGVTAVLGMICTFLPWASIPFFGSVDGTHGDGWISFGVCAVAGLLSLVGERRSALPTGAVVGSALCGVAASLIGLVDLINLKDRLAEAELGGFVSVGPGLYVLIVTGVAIVVLPALLSLQGKSAPPQQYWSPPPQGYWQPQQQPRPGWPPSR